MKKYERLFVLVVRLVGMLSLTYPALTIAETAPGVTIYYEENAQVELVDAAGTRVLLDVFRPSSLSSPATDKDVLLTTHTHPDHVNTEFQKNFPGQQLFKTSGKLTLPGVNITSLDSAHNANVPLGQGGNYIFIVEMGGLRIAHFGDIGQDALTPEQLTALGKIDVAITQFENSFSGMFANATEKTGKGFTLMDQVKPRVIIPTHSGMAAGKIAVEQWKSFAAGKPSITVRPDQLPPESETYFIFMGTAAASFQKIHNLPTTEW